MVKIIRELVIGEEMKMTWREEDMYPYVWRNLRARFPAYEGWEIYEKDRWKGYEPDFVVERRFRRRIERVVVEVKATCKVSWAHIKQLNMYARNLSGRNVTIVEKILVVPAGADTSTVPDDIEVLYLRKFECENNDIIWYQ